MNASQKPLWTEARTFTDESAGIAVIVSRMSGYRPRFSYAIKSRVETRERGIILVPFFQVGVVTEHARVTKLIGGLNTTSLFGLLAEVDEWIRGECQRREDEIISERVDREQRDLARDKPKQRPGLKSLSKRDAAARG